MPRSVGGLSQRLAERRKVAWAAAAEAEAGQTPLDVRAALQPLAQSLAQLRAVHKKLDRVEPLGDRSRLGQWRRQVIGEEAGAGPGHRMVDRREQAPLALAGEGRHEFEIAPRRRIDLHDRCRHDLPGRFEMRRPSLLGQPDVIHEGAGSGELGAAKTAEPVERADPVEFLQAAARRLALEAGIGQRRQGRLPFGQHLEQRRAGQQPLRHQDLARDQTGEIGGERGFAGRSQRKGAGRQVEPGEPDLPSRLGDAGEIIVPARVQETLLGQGAGGHDTGDRPPHRSLAATPPRLGGILDLVADRDLEPGADQPREIGFGSVDRDAAHRDVRAVVPAALGQRNIERLRGGDRVVKEQLEKISHPEEQQAAGVRLLDLEVLGHHRRRRWMGIFVHRRGATLAGV